MFEVLAKRILSSNNCRSRQLLGIQRRKNGNSVLKNGIQLDNRHVVPYNPVLLMKFQAHINMGWCNQSSSIKYSFKYINKGYDRMIVAIVPSDDKNPTKQ